MFITQYILDFFPLEGKDVLLPRHGKTIVVEERSRAEKLVNRMLRRGDIGVTIDAAIVLKSRDVFREKSGGYSADGEKFSSAQEMLAELSAH